MKHLTIGKLAELTGITADTLRYYEKMKLIKASVRSQANYRFYEPEAVRIIRFIRGAKELGFTLAEIRTLLALNASNNASCVEVILKAEDKIKEATAKIAELKEIKKTLGQLVKVCPGDKTSAKDCPILDHIKR